MCVRVCIWVSPFSSKKMHAKQWSKYMSHNATLNVSSYSVIKIGRICWFKFQKAWNNVRMSLILAVGVSVGAHRGHFKVSVQVSQKIIEVHWAEFWYLLLCVDRIDKERELEVRKLGETIEGVLLTWTRDKQYVSLESKNLQCLPWTVSPMGAEALPWFSPFMMNGCFSKVLRKNFLLSL